MVAVSPELHLTHIGSWAWLRYRSGLASNPLSVTKVGCHWWQPTLPENLLHATFAWSRKQYYRTQGISRP